MARKPKRSQGIVKVFLDTQVQIPGLRGSLILNWTKSSKIKAGNTPVKSEKKNGEQSPQSSSSDVQLGNRWQICPIRDLFWLRTTATLGKHNKRYESVFFSLKSKTIFDPRAPLYCAWLRTRGVKSVNFIVENAWSPDKQLLCCVSADIKTTTTGHITWC